MARIYSNENFPLPVVEALRSLGHDVQITRDAGKDGQALPDEDVLRHAAANGRVLLTLNRLDFKRLHRSNPGHAEIVLCTFDPDFAGQASRIHALLVENPNPQGQLLRAKRPASP